MLLKSLDKYLIKLNRYEDYIMNWYTGKLAEIDFKYGSVFYRVKIKLTMFF